MSSTNLALNCLSLSSKLCSPKIQVDSFIPDLEVSRDVVCLVQCLRLIGESISMEMALVMEMACSRLQPPEKAAEQILEDLIASDT